MDVRYCCVLMTPACAALCSDAANSDVASTATSEFRPPLRMNYLLVRSSQKTLAEALPFPLVLGPPGDELVEVDELVVVRIDVFEPDLDLAARHFCVELIEHGGELVELNPAVTVSIVVVERFAQLVEHFFGRSVLRHGMPLLGQIG